MRRMLTPRSSQSTPRLPSGGAAPTKPAGGTMMADGSFSCLHGSLTPQEVELARANFREFDVDGDGIISHQV
jgi:hypothetical protein